MTETFQRRHQALYHYYRLPSWLDEVDRLPPSLTELIHCGRIAFLPLTLNRDDATILHDMLYDRDGGEPSPIGRPSGPRRRDDELALIKLLWSAARFSDQHHVLVLTCPEEAHSLETFERLGVESCLFISAQELLGRLDRLVQLDEGHRRHGPAGGSASPDGPAPGPADVRGEALQLPSGWRIDGPGVGPAARRSSSATAEIDPSLRTLIAQVFNREFHDIELSRLVHVQRLHIGRLTANLAEIERSAGWALVRRVAHLRRRLVPEGSRRERAWRLGMRVVKLSATRGLRTALVEGIAAGRRRVRALVGRPVPDDVQGLAPGSAERASAGAGPRTATADVVVCVHNALEDVRRCLESIVRSASPPDSLIVVDDGSGAETADYLDAFSRAYPCRLVRNEAARGYTFAANQGLEASSGDFVILLNSDTVVSPGWVDRLIVCAESDPRIGLVGPLSNTASWQSIPDISGRDGDWGANPLDEGTSPEDMARSVARHSDRLYPRLPFLNGFCLLIRRQVLDEVGRFDEDAFGRGYGEENDYCLRAAKAGWQLAVADDVYVYHRQSRSYSNARRKLLGEQASRALERKHGRGPIEAGVAICHNSRVLRGIRARSRWLTRRDRMVEAGRKRWEGRRVLFILPITGPGGGANVVIQECAAMRRMGVDARAFNFEEFREDCESSYPDLDIPVVYREQGTDLRELAAGFDAFVATHCSTVRMLEPLVELEHPPRLGYYIQDFEPYFVRPGSRDFARELAEARFSYTRIGDLIRFTKTEWNREEVHRQIGVDCHLVGPSVNVDLFRPRERSLPGRRGVVRVAAMIRPSSPYREPALTMRVLGEVYDRHPGAVQFLLFGCETDDPEFLALPRRFPWRNHGVLNPQQLSRLLNEADVFVDLSSHQAMGLTAMEAMACGATVVVPRSGGADTFVEDGSNGLIVDTRSPSDCVHAVSRLVADEALRDRLQRNAMEDICRFFPERAAFNILDLLFPPGDPRPGS